MKKLICVLLAMLFVGLTFTSCTSKTSTTTTAATTKAPGITSLADLNGKKVAVQASTTSEDFANALLAKGQIKFQILPYEKVTECFDDLALGRVDAVLVDQVVAAYYSSGKSKIVWQNTVGEPMGICLKKGNDDLTALVEKAVDTLYYNGTVAKVATQYFGSDVTKGVRTVTTKPVLDLTKLKTIKAGTLMVGMEIGYPPMEYLKPNGIDYTGFDVDLAQKIADLFGLKLQIVNTAWSGIFAALNKGEFDIMMSSVSITAARQAAFDMTKPYVSNRIVLAVPNN
jgi:ABC-type amino acid transport substrate-binding protein